MKQIKLLVLILAGFNMYSAAQKESNKWYFGNYAAVDFNSGSPVALMNCAMSQREGCSSIADSNGNLLFYTNGVNVWDSTNTVMPNGTGLKGHDSSTQSALIVKQPGSSNIYYIFTTPANFMTDSMYYSIADMTLNGGLGDIAVKNIPVSPDVCEKLAGVNNANGTSIWVVCHGYNDNSFRAFLLDASGLNLTPVISNAGAIVNVSSAKLGQLKFSPAGNKAAAAYHDGINHYEFYDFDNATGIISNPVITASTGLTSGAYGVEFSAGGTKVYCSTVTNSRIYQYDLSAGSAAAILASQIIIHNNPSLSGGSLQLAPDGKIYFACEYQHNLRAINNPDAAGFACNYTDSALYLGGPQCALGLPAVMAGYLPNTTNVVEIAVEINPVIYPNPSTGFFYWNAGAAGTHKKFYARIYDSNGKRVFEKECTPGSDYSINSHLPDGFYTLNILNDKSNYRLKLTVINSLNSPR